MDVFRELFWGNDCEISGWLWPIAVCSVQLHISPVVKSHPNIREVNETKSGLARRWYLDVSEWCVGEFDAVVPIGVGLIIAPYVNFSVRYYYDFEKVSVKSLNQAHIWQASSQLTCAYSCRMWTRYPIDNRCGDDWFSGLMSPQTWT